MAVMKSYAELICGTIRAQLTDCALQYPDLAREFNRDYQRLSSAIECHGIRFALDVMPAFRKHLDKCLEKRRLTSSGLTHFGSDKKKGVIPKLFRGLTLRVFDRSGELKSDPDIRSIILLRQLLGVVRKLRLDCSHKARVNEVREFIKTDDSIRLGTLSWSDFRSFDATLASKMSFLDLIKVEDAEALPLFGERSDYALAHASLLRDVQLVADIVSAQIGPFWPEQAHFRHGPGAVSDRPYGAYRYAFKRWPERLEAVFPYSEFAVANYACLENMPTREGLSSFFGREDPAKLCAVPKSITRPRLIASEPSYLQWCQQALRDHFYERVRGTFLSRFVDFRRQEKNGHLALQASIGSDLATIDLSEASDRISCWHVERLFRQTPTVLDAMQASRSVWLKQDIDKYSPMVRTIRKYSTMGNATTFPVQSIFFLVLALACVLHARGKRITIKNISDLGSSQVRVFGDDIVIHKDGTGLLLELFPALSLKVNVNKTFTEGNFRESCGIDAFAGVDVTTVNVLDFPDRSRPGTIVSTVDVHKNLCDRGYVTTARFLRKTAPERIRSRIRTVSHGSGSFGWSDLEAPINNSSIRYRFNKHLHRREAYCLCQKAKARRTLPETTAGLLQFFTEAAEKVTSATSSLGYLTQRPKAKLSLGWVPLD